MKAIVLENKDQPLIIKEVDDYQIGADEVLIRIKSAAFNHRDLWIQKGQYAGLKYPIILGSDGSGIVSQIGDNVDKRLLNQDVIINPSHNWGDNIKAQSNSFKILGLPDDGTFAQYAKVNAKYVAHKPQNLDFNQAAAIPLAGLTAYRSLFTRAKLEKGEKVLVTGIGGGVALFALQFALASGADVYVTSSSEQKIEQAIKLGATGGINYTKDDWHKELLKISGNFDVIVDSAGGEGFNKLIDLASNGGRIVFFGATKGAVPNLVLQKIFWKQLSLLGSTMGSEDDFDNMVKFVEKHNIKPVIDQIFKMDQAEKAIKRMEEGSQFGKIILEIS